MTWRYLERACAHQAAFKSQTSSPVSHRENFAPTKIPTRSSIVLDLAMQINIRVIVADIQVLRLLSLIRQFKRGPLDDKDHLDRVTQLQTRNCRG